MKVSGLLGLVGLAGLSYAAKDVRIPRNYEKNDYYVLHLERSASPDHIAARLGLAHEGQLHGMRDHHVFRAPKTEHDIVKIEIKERKMRKRALGGEDVLDSVLLAKKQATRKPHEKRVVPPPPPGYVQKRASSDVPQKWAIEAQQQIMDKLGITDPIFQDQWHIFNPVQIGHDMNVTGVWLEGITGKNATVAFVDDGLDMNSKDLAPNYYAEGSYDFNDHDPVPAPVLSDDRHGTRCAGEVAAAKNDVCGVGLAYESRVSGLRILSGAISDVDEAESLIYDHQNNQVYSCSWGPPDDGRSMEAPDVLIRRAMLTGIQEGRGGLGSIYVFASGNGAASDDNCNFDGYTNSIYSITVGAVDREGNHPYYSELCSAQLVVAYSSGTTDAIHTTDVGVDTCNASHGGTSAAAPLAAGIYALILEIRPDLTWRDFQYISMDTAGKVEDPQAGWVETAAGRHFSHTYGYGKIDGYSAVQMAKEFKSLKPQAWFFSPWLHVKKAIPEGKDGLVSSFTVTKDMLSEANLDHVEHVTVTMNIDHTRRGDLSVDLISPEGFVSHISTARKNDAFAGGYDDWTFMSVAHWGESGVGEWKVIVRDTVKNEHNGKFIDWHLKLWGESIDADKATLLPMPDEHDDDDHDVIKPVVSTKIEGEHPEPTDPAGNPDDHIDRPTKQPNPKPTGTPEEEPEEELDEEPEEEPTEQPDEKPEEKPEEKPSETEEETGTSTEEAQEATSSPSSWINWFPSWGKSKKAQIWIFGAIGLILAFCAGLGAYLFIARRRRMRNDPRNNYEFELIQEDEAEGLNSGEKNTGAGIGGRRGGRRTRGGELYDAFAGGSDEEPGFYSDDDDDSHNKQRGYADEDYSDRSRSERPGGDEEEQYVVGDESDDDSAVHEKRR